MLVIVGRSRRGWGLGLRRVVLLLNKEIELCGVKRLGLGTPYSDDVQKKIVGGNGGCNGDPGGTGEAFGGCEKH